MGLLPRAALALEVKGEGRDDPDLHVLPTLAAAQRAVLRVEAQGTDREAHRALDLARWPRGRATPKPAEARILAIDLQRQAVPGLHARDHLVQGAARESEQLELADQHARAIDPLAQASDLLDPVDHLVQGAARASEQLELADQHAQVIDPLAQASALLDPVDHLVQGAAQVAHGRQQRVAHETSEPMDAISKRTREPHASVATCPRAGGRWLDEALRRLTETQLPLPSPSSRVNHQHPKTSGFSSKMTRPSSRKWSLSHAK